MVDSNGGKTANPSLVTQFCKMIFFLSFFSFKSISVWISFDPTLNFLSWFQIMIKVGISLQILPRAIEVKQKIECSICL